MGESKIRLRDVNTWDTLVANLKDVYRKIANKDTLFAVATLVVAKFAGGAEMINSALIEYQMVKLIEHLETAYEGDDGAGIIKTVTSLLAIGSAHADNLASVATGMAVDTVKETLTSESGWGIQSAWTGFKEYWS